MSITVSNIFGMRNIHFGPAEPARVGVLLGSNSFDRFNDTIILDSGEIISVGKNGNSESGYSAVIAKFDQRFNKMLTYNVGSDNNSIEFNTVCKDSNDNICAFGTYKDGDYFYGLGVKLDSDFNLISMRRIGVFGSNEIIQSCSIDSNDNVFIVGRTGPSNDSDFLIVKLNSSLNLLVRKEYGNGSATFNPHDFASVGKVDSSGNYYIAGRSNSATSSNQYDAIIMKFDNNLSLIRQNKIYLSNDSFEDILDMEFNSAGDRLYIVGRTNDFNTSTPWSGFAGVIQTSNLSLIDSKVYVKSDNSNSTIENIAASSTGFILGDGSGNLTEIDSNLSIVSQSFIFGTNIDDIYYSEQGDIYLSGIQNSKGFVFKTSSITENETINFQPSASNNLVETSLTFSYTTSSLDNITSNVSSISLNLPVVNIPYTDEAA